MLFDRLIWIAVSVVGALLFRFLAPTGRRRLEEMFKEGLPEYLRAPLLFLLGSKLDPKDQEIARKIEAIRAKLSRYRESRRVLYAFAQDTETGKSLHESKILSLSWIAKVVSVHKYWGTFLYLSANAAQAKTIIELGSCIGISSLYLASAKFCRRFITIEGSPELSELTKANLGQLVNNYQVVNASFDSGLDQILPSLTDRIDMAFIDGDHQRDSTINYFQRLLPHLNEGSLVVFDDIQWSDEMVEAWQILSRWKGVGAAINLGRFGVCVWTGGTTPPKVFDLSTFTTLWRKGRPKYPERTPFAKSRPLSF